MKKKINTKKKKEKKNFLGKIFVTLILTIFLMSNVAYAISESYVEYEYPSDTGRAAAASNWYNWFINLFKVEKSVPIIISREITADECYAKNGQYTSYVDYTGATKCIKQKNCAPSGTACSCDSDPVAISYCSGGTQCTSGAKECNSAGNSLRTCNNGQWSAYTSCSSGVCSNGACGGQPADTCTYYGATIAKNMYYCAANGIKTIFCYSPGTSIPYTEASCPAGKTCSPGSVSSSISTLCSGSGIPCTSDAVACQANNILRVTRCTNGFYANTIETSCSPGVCDLATLTCKQTIECTSDSYYCQDGKSYVKQCVNSKWAVPSVSENCAQNNKLCDSSSGKCAAAECTGSIYWCNDGTSYRKDCENGKYTGSKLNKACYNDQKVCDATTGQCGSSLEIAFSDKFFMNSPVKINKEAFKAGEDMEVKVNVINKDGSAAYSHGKIEVGIYPKSWAEKNYKQIVSIFTTQAIYNVEPIRICQYETEQEIVQAKQVLSVDKLADTTVTFNMKAPGTKTKIGSETGWDNNGEYILVAATYKDCGKATEISIYPRLIKITDETTTTGKCSECGVGVENVCDKDECKALSDSDKLNGGPGCFPYAGGNECAADVIENKVCCRDKPTGTTILSNKLLYAPLKGCPINYEILNDISSCGGSNIKLCADKITEVGECSKDNKKCNAENGELKDDASCKGTTGETQISLTRKEFFEAPSSVQMQMMCSADENCKPYQNAEYSEERLLKFVSKCKTDDLIQAELKKAADEVCQNSFWKKFGIEASITGATACGAGIALMALSIPTIPFTGGTVSLATGATTVAVCTGAAIAVEQTLIGCSIFKSPDLSKGICLATEKGGPEIENSWTNFVKTVSESLGVDPGMAQILIIIGAVILLIIFMRLLNPPSG